MTLELSNYTKPMLNAKSATLTLPILAALLAFPHQATAQTPAGDGVRTSGMAEHAMGGTMSGPMDENMMKHMQLTPPRTPTHADSLRATRVAAELKLALAKYQDTAAAVADGYKMFLPNVKTQRIYHFTNNRRGLLAAFHFDAAKPTSILYKRGADGKLHLVGAMYTLGKNASLDRLDARVPLSIARWHKHVNWCLPAKGEEARWTEQKNGKPVFGPESPIATERECDAVHGDFQPTVFGWMLHANVYEGADLHTIFADDHE